MTTALPAIIDGWPVRYEARGIEGEPLTAVVDGSRLSMLYGAGVVIAIDGRGHGRLYGISREELDGQPLDALPGIARAAVLDMLDIEIIPRLITT